MSFQGMGGILHNWLPWKNDAEWCKGECLWLNKECVQDNSLKRWMYGETEKFIWPKFSEVKSILEELFGVPLFVVVLIFAVFLFIFELLELNSMFGFGRKSYKISAGEQSLCFNNKLIFSSD